MRMLSSVERGYIERQLYNRARDIDVSLFNYLTDFMPNDMVIDCLMFYQNNDGGFGNGLYIDNYDTNSSVYQTYEAFRILEMADFDNTCDSELFDHLINKACNFLYNRCPIKDNKWNPFVKTTTNFAHAKIFEDTKENKDLFGYHPSMSLFAYTLLYCKPTKAYFKKALKNIDLALKDILTKDSFTTLELLDFNNFIRIIKKAKVEIKDFDKFVSHITNYVKTLDVSVKFEDEGVIRPLMVSSELDIKELEDKKSVELDYIIASICPHGLWEKNTKWEASYPEEDSAKLKWIGAESVNNYFILKKYGRIE